MQWRTVLLGSQAYTLWCVLGVRPSSLISSFRLEKLRGLLHTELQAALKHRVSSVSRRPHCRPVFHQTGLLRPLLMSGPSERHVIITHVELSHENT